MAIVVNQSSLVRTQVGNKTRVTGTFAFTTYQTGGPAILAKTLGLDQLEQGGFVCDNQGGYVMDPIVSANQSQVNVIVYGGTGGGGGTTSATSGGTPTGTVSAPTFTGTPATLTITVGAGVVADAIGFSAGGALVSTAGGTITLNAYTPAGTNSTPAFAGAALAPHTHTYGGGGGGAGTEVTNGTNLAGLGNIPFQATGI